MGQKLRKQVTCWCGAYDFPHRINGGRCTGREWVESYFWFARYACQYCNSNCGGNECDVANGQEPLKYCDGYRDDLQKQMGMRHPVSLADSPLYDPRPEEDQDLSCGDPDDIPFDHEGTRELVHHDSEEIPF